MEDKYPLLMLELTDPKGNRANLNLPVPILLYLWETGGLELVFSMAGSEQLKELDLEGILQKTADGFRGEVVHMTRKDGVTVVGKVEDR